jgi:hypothetical protein
LRNIKTVTVKLLEYCRENDWAGYDPYDALNSEIFKALPFFDFRLFRLSFTQLMKRLPFNLRSLLLVPRIQNPKGLALFLASFIKLSKLGLPDQENIIGEMAERLVALRSPGTHYWSWGYSFPWQTRTIVVPRWAPNLVCSTFVANAFLDAYENDGESRYLTMAASTADYILKELYWTEGNSVACLSYPLPSSRARVHNANFLGAALLCRVYRHSGDKRLLDTALKVARYSAAQQRDDGSWYYGELSTQRWIDNFHTGYNLCALKSICQYTETSEFESNILRGFEFYRQCFFKQDGAPKYFHDRTYPIDIHCVAQSIITLVAFKNIDEGNLSLAHSVFNWAIANMMDDKGFFYYQILHFTKNKIPYMRWSQAWMLLAISTLLGESAQKGGVR